MTEFSFMPGQQQTPDAGIGFSGGREAESVSDLQSFLPDTPSLPPVTLPPEDGLNWTDDVQQTPDFATSPLTFGEARALRGAYTGVRNLQSGLTRAGFGRDVEEELAELEPGIYNTLVEPTFDLLSIGAYTVAGAADELLETGNLGAALRQGAIEFYNALPGVSHKEARRLTSADILLEHTDAFGTSTGGRWAAMGLGLVMDVILDPLTSPFLGLKIAQKGVGIARTGERLGGLGLGLNTTPLLNVGGRKLVDGIRNRGGSAGIVNVLARHQIPGAQKFGDWFLPDFEFKQAIHNAPTGEIRKEMQTAYDSFRQQRIGMVARYNEDTRHLGEVAAKIRKDLTQEENLFLGLWLDQSDEAFDKAVTGAAQKFSQNTDSPFQFSRDTVLEKARLFRKEYREMADRETKLGLWDKTDIRDFYNPGRSPTTPYSARFWRGTRDESSADQLSREQIEILEGMGWKNPVDPSQPRTAVGRLQGTEKMAAAQQKSYQTVQERWIAGEPTELHASLNFIQRGQESVRAISARGFLHSVAGDPTISRRIKNPAEEVLTGGDVSLDDIANPHKMQELHRQGYAVVDLASIKPLSTVKIAGEELTGTKAIDDALNLDIDSIRRLGSEKDSALHIMPIPLIKDLMKGTKALSDESLIKDLADKFMKFSGVWKAYALFSPGYHARNMYSNWYQNWMAGITDHKLYMKSLALQYGGTENIPFGARQIVERRIGKMSMGKGKKWVEGDDVWFEAAGTKLNGNQVNKLLDDHLVNDTGLFARDMFIDTEKQLLRQREKNVTHSLYAIPTKVHDEIMDELDGTVYTVDEREFIAELAEARVKTRALSENISVEEAWGRERWRITPHDDLDAQNVDGAWLLQDGEKIHMDIVGGPYGERIEKAIDGAFYDNPMPTYDQLRGIPGLESIRKRDMTTFVDQFRSARDKYIGDNSWWKRYGQEVQARIGEANMPEFSMVFSIAKGNPAERLKETFGVMGMAREGGTSVAGLPEQYKTLYKQGMTDLEKLASQRSNFFGFTPRDENIPRFFSDKFNVANEDSYRSVSHLVRKMAQMDNMSLEDAEAVVWNVVNRKKDDISAPAIDWDSAWAHAKEEVDSFFAFEPRRAMPGFQVRRLMPRAHGVNAPNSVASLGLLNNAKLISSLGFKSTGDAGAFGVSGHSLDSTQQIEFGTSLLNEVTDPDGQQITALKELDELFGSRHYIRTHIANINGSPEPTFHLVVEGGDERLSKFYGTILADAFDQDQVRFITPTPTGGNGDALLLRRESGAWSDEQIRDVMERSMDSFDVNPDRQFITLVNHDNDPEWLSRVSKMIGGDTDIVPEHFRFQGEVVDNDDFGRILAETRGAVTHKRGPDILKRITRDLHESYVQAYERIGRKYGLRHLRGKDEVLRGSSRGLRGADDVILEQRSPRRDPTMRELQEFATDAAVKAGAQPPVFSVKTTPKGWFTVTVEGGGSTTTSRPMKDQISAARFAWKEWANTQPAGKSLLGESSGGRKSNLQAGGVAERGPGIESGVKFNDSILFQRDVTREVDALEEELTRPLREGLVGKDNENFRKWREGVDDPAYSKPENNRYNLEHMGDGDPTILFHGTRMSPSNVLGGLGDAIGTKTTGDFVSFKLPREQMGIHAGTLRQSSHFSVKIDLAAGASWDRGLIESHAGARTFPVVVRGNFIRMPDLGTWSPREVWAGLKDTGMWGSRDYDFDLYTGKIVHKGPQDELDELWDLMDAADTKKHKTYRATSLPTALHRNLERDVLREWLKARGITGIVYRNTAEGTGLAEGVHSKLMADLGNLSREEVIDLVEKMPPTPTRKELVQAFDPGATGVGVPPGEGSLRKYRDLPGAGTPADPLGAFQQKWEDYLYVLNQQGGALNPSLTENAQYVTFWKGLRKLRGESDDYSAFLDDFTSGQDSYMVLDPGDIKGVFNQGTWDPGMKDMLKQTLNGKRGNPRGVLKGAIDLADEANAIIHLTRHADVSTMIHELGHYWRRGLNTKDSKVIEDWIGSAFKNWDVPNEEMFARGFEKYMREGVAPTEELGDLFDQAKVYMEFVYAKLRGSPLTDEAMPQEVKDVFGRILGDGALELDEPTIKALNTRPKIRNVTDATQVVGDWLDRNVGVNSAHIKFSRRFGQSVENNSRITHFMGTLQKVMGEGLDLDRGAIMAKDSVDKYLFDYNLGLTDFERSVVRPLVPFYSWMRFNIPLQIQTIFENPARYSRVPKLINNMEAMTRDWQGIETPDYFRELQAFRLPAIMNSKPVYLNPNLPFQDLNRTLLTGFPDVLANLTPFIRVAGELVPERGYSTFLESPIEKYTGQRAKDLHLPFLPSTTLGVSKKWENAINSLFPPLGKLTRFNKAQRRDEASMFLASEIFGIKMMNVDTQRTLRGETYAKRKALTDLKKRLEDEHNIHIDTRQRTRRGRRRQRKKKEPQSGYTF